MTRVRILLGLITAIITLAISATPALAEFEATSGNGTSQGAFQLEAESTVVFTMEGVPLTCTEVVNGQWHIGISKQEIKPQPLTKRGPHLELTGSFTKCTAQAGGLKLSIALNQCSLQVRQTPGSTEGTGKATSDCEVKIPALKCTLKITAASNEGPLKEVKFATVTGGIAIFGNVTGITYVAGEGCPVKSGSAATFTAKSIAHGLKLV